MSLRALSLVLALLSAPAVADEIDDVEDSGRSPASAARGGESRGSAARLDDVLLGSDGRLAGCLLSGGGAGRFVPWDLVRLVLPDVDRALDEPYSGCTAAPIEQDVDQPLSLRSTIGRAVVDERGAAVGVVREVLVGWRTGFVHAIAIEIADPELGSRRIAVPWSRLDRAPGGAGRAPFVVDGEFVRGAPDLRHAG
jgi:sporulation protein YlmC with PRC-barrel domain